MWKIVAFTLMATFVSNRSFYATIESVWPINREWPMECWAWEPKYCISSLFVHYKRHVIKTGLKMLTGDEDCGYIGWVMFARELLVAPFVYELSITSNNRYYQSMFNRIRQKCVCIDHCYDHKVVCLDKKIFEFLLLLYDRYII